MNFLTKTTLSFLFVFVCLYSCQKETNSRIKEVVPKHELDTEDEAVIKVRQAIAVDDGDGFSDSTSYVNPPTDRYYEWHILPNTNCVTLWGNHRYGRAIMTFNCAGRYQVAATIYDSATRKLIAETDTMQIEVTQDTLYRTQALQKDDVLTLQATVAKSIYDPNKPATTLPNEVFVSMNGITSKRYEYFETELNFASTSTNGNYSFVFSDSVRLNGYPFARGKGLFYPVQPQIELKGLKIGVPANLSLTWLGKTYTGKVTLVYENHFSIDWDSSGNVKIN
jgi:hypothetical protein